MKKIILSVVISIFSIVNICLSAPPVELVSFDAVQKTSNVEIKWITASEASSDHFVVERTLTGEIDYIEIGSVPAAGNSASEKNYILKDSTIVPFNTYRYRLKMVDMDGIFEYSNELEIQVNFDVDFRNPELYDKGTAVEVKWNTMNEIMVEGFFIKRDVKSHFNDSRNFQVFLAAEGGVKKEQNYQFNDSLVKENDLIEYSIYVKPINVEEDSVLYKGEIKIVSSGINEFDKNYFNINCSPNPFGESTTITYTLPENENVNITITDITGNVIRTFNEGFKEKKDEFLLLTIKTYFWRLNNYFYPEYL